MSAKKFCVLGQGISYSLSPVHHSAIFEFFGEDCEYGVADVPPEKLYETVKKLIGEYDGFNVTKPYKESVARILGASGPINTVRCADCAATSTDAEGFFVRLYRGVRRAERRYTVARRGRRGKVGCRSS